MRKNALVAGLVLLALALLPATASDAREVELDGSESVIDIIGQVVGSMYEQGSPTLIPTSDDRELLGVLEYLDKVKGVSITREGLDGNGDFIISFTEEGLVVAQAIRLFVPVFEVLGQIINGGEVEDDVVDDFPVPDGIRCPYASGCG